MRKTFYPLIVFLLLFAQITTAQTNEIGAFFGGSNFTGDVGATALIRPKQPAFGIIYKWNITPRYSFRFSGIFSKLKARDANSNIEPRQIRDYNFENKITELSAGIEYNIFKFDIAKKERESTPYLYTGLSYFWSDHLYVVNGVYKSSGQSTSVSIPLIAGYKFNILKQLNIGAEVGVRYTFIDDIDGSNPKEDSLKNLQFSNTESRDWYVFTGITATYVFGETRSRSCDSCQP
jgi:hypothetical protein